MKKEKKIKVYIAGPYDSDNVVGVLDNMRRGMRAGTELMLKGYAPFVPWHDYHFQLSLIGDETLEKNAYQEASIAWMLSADAILVLPGWEQSGGVQRELEIACRRGMAIFFDQESLDRWASI